MDTRSQIIVAAMELFWFRGHNADLHLGPGLLRLRLEPSIVKIAA